MKNFLSRKSSVYFKTLLLSFFICFIFFDAKVVAQSKFLLKIENDPVRLPFSKPFNQENGLGYYQIHALGKPNVGFYGNLSWFISKSAGIALGFGYHNFKYEVNYDILNPLDESSSFMKNFRFFSASAYGPSVSVFYHKNRIEMTLGVNAFQPNKVMKSHDSSISDNFFFDPSSSATATLRIDETFSISRRFSYAVAFFQVGYMFSKNIYFNLGVENNLSNGLPYYYRLQIVGNTINTSNEEHILNDFIFLSKYSGIKVGISYNFFLKKRSQIK